MTATAAPSGVLLDRVPVYPVMRLELRDGIGEAEGVVDGVAVASGDGSSVRSALVAAAAEAAARRPCGAIRVRLAGFGSDEAGVVTSTGELVSAALPAPVRSRRRVLLLLAAVLVVVLAVGGLLVVSRSGHAWWSSRQTRAVPVAPGPSPTQLPVVAPQGWSAVARWSLPLASASSSASVAAWGSLVFAPGGDGVSVVAVDAGSGRRVWSAAPGKSVVGGSLAGGPVVFPMGGHSLVAAWTSDRFCVWAPAMGAAVGSWPLPADTSAVSAAGDSALVLGQGQHAQVFDGHSLVSRVLPAGASPVGATADGALVAAGAGRAWVVRSDRVAGPGTPLAAPSGVGWVQPVGLAGGVLVVAYSAASSPQSVVLRAYATSTWAPVWTSAPLPATREGGGAAGSSPLWTAPDGSWGIYGSTLLNLATGAGRALPADWSTSAIGPSRAFGTTGGAVGSVTPSGVVTAAAGSSAAGSSGSAPVAPSAVTGDGWALVVASDGSRPSVYAVPPTVQDARPSSPSFLKSSSPAATSSSAPTGSGDR